MFWTGSKSKLLSENYPLLSILVGIMLVSVSIGPFQNGDTQLEYEAASGVIRWGLPYAVSFGNMINQPPLGFYVEGLFFKVFGLSFGTGVVLVTLFGLGCAVLVYEIGKVLYGKTTGLFAAALFALAPWELVLSRSFLIDVQCLFFSLLFLFVGISAIRKDSLKLFMVSGTLFAAALLTKLYAVFALIPLMLFYLHYRPNLKRMLRRLGAFFLPILLLAFIWYQVISGQGLVSIFHHEDLAYNNPSEIVPSHFFVFNFLLNYGLGGFFLVATGISLLVSVLRRRLFSKILVFDLICLTTILVVTSADTFLGAGLNLRSPYFNAIKYDYQSLPFFSLLAASLVSKCLPLFSLAKLRGKLNKLLFSIVLVGLVLLVSSLFVSLYYAHLFSILNFLLFRVERGTNAGYSLFNPSPMNANNPLMNFQYLGFILMLSGLSLSCISNLQGSARSAESEFQKARNRPTAQLN